MANENETVEQACDVLYAYPKAEVCDGSGITVLNNNKIADRILAAHKREIAAKDDERKGLLKANDSLVANNTQLCGEVDSLKWKVENYAHAVAAREVEIASLRALVKEMSDLLTKVNDVEYVDVFAWFDGCVDAEQQEWLDSAMGAIRECQLAFGGIVAKAREVVSKMETTAEVAK